jgi:error-prone DNA polymerase
MLPRLEPKTFYDLVIEVAIVRPGPIQGDMVHPYLRRREKKEEVVYPKEELREVLEKTLGVPLFQEQAMRIAIVAAGFSPEEADRLRRSMATFKRLGQVSRFRDPFVEGMVRRGYEREFAARCFQQIEGFGTYGFPESHAASFALLVYVSAWIKHHYPEIFAASLLNSQPMGFYAPAQIVRDASGHGVEVRPVDVNASGWDCTLEEFPRPSGEREGPAAEPREGEGERCGNRFALRLGLRQIIGLLRKDADRLTAARGAGFATPHELWRRAGIGSGALEQLAAADAFRSMGLDRRQALWAVKGLGGAPLPLFAALDAGGPEPEGTQAALPAMRDGEHVAEDYATIHMTLRRHPLSFLREEFVQEGMVRAADLMMLPAGRRVAVAGLVLIRQRPGTASGVVFVTIEDETGIANLIVWPQMVERFRRPLLGATLLQCTGRLQREGRVIHVVAERLADLTPRLATLRSRGVPVATARADEAKHPPTEKPRYPFPPGLRVKSRDFR